MTTPHATTEAPAVNWAHWLGRWDAQQQGYLPDREERFAAMLDVLGVLLPPTFRALDLCSGPGAISQRLLQRFPDAHCLALDLDPLLLAMGQGALGDLGGRLRWGEVDLLHDDLAAAVGDETLDAVLSTTALHWLPAERLLLVYRQLAQLIRPGGVFLNGDNIPFSGLPTFQQVTDRWNERMQQEAFSERGQEDWAQWWAALAATPGTEALLAERARRFPQHHGTLAMPSAALHEAMLRDAGFSEVGTIWQHGDNRILMAVR